MLVASAAYGASMPTTLTFHPSPSGLMDSQIELPEDRLKSFVTQLEVESGIFERLVYKNKNQHRNCSYFQYLLKVRRDLRLLHSARLEESLKSCFLVINGNKPAQKVHLLESLKRKKFDGGRYNFMERLLGAARLLSQMVEPMLRAATGLSIVLAQAFFMGFSVTMLALLARMRVLVQQMLLDVVSVYNMVSVISHQEQSIKLTQEGIEVFRQYYPRNDEQITLDCTWKSDKFVLLERIDERKTGTEYMDQAKDTCLDGSAIKYQSIEAILGDDEPSTDGADIVSAAEVAAQTNDEKLVYLGGLTVSNNERGPAEECSSAEDGAGSGTPSKQYLLKRSASSFSNPLKRKSGPAKDVAFIPVKRPAISAENPVGLQGKEAGSNNSAQEDSLFNLLTVGTQKDSIF